MVELFPQSINRGVDHLLTLSPNSLGTERLTRLNLLSG